MTTTKHRIQVSLSHTAQRMLPKLARAQNVPAATYAASLIDEALELHEDAVLSAIGDARFAATPKKWLSHTQVWNRGNSRTTQK